jgi:saccharopine dehydrogenase-like NADP-dependent oxidoreductase
MRRRHLKIALSIVLSLLLFGATDGYDISFRALRGKRVLVVGGSGRVGGSVVTQLVRHGGHVSVAGTRPRRLEEARQRWIGMFPELSGPLSVIPFEEVQRERVETVRAVLEKSDYDLVIHTAGPFQGKVGTPNGVLEACVDAGVPYLDVCDDYCTARAAQTKFASQATSPCILSTGCWPGVSSLMAKQLVESSLAAFPELGVEDLSVDFSFFTAG